MFGDVPNRKSKEGPPKATVADRAALATVSALPATRRAVQLECGRQVADVLRDQSLRGLKSPPPRARKVFCPSTSSSPVQENGRGSSGGSAVSQGLRCGSTRCEDTAVFREGYTPIAGERDHNKYQ